MEEKKKNFFLAGNMFNPLNITIMKYQVIEINEYLVNVNEYDKMEEAMKCFKTWIEDAKEYPMLRTKHIYLTIEHRIKEEWHSL